MRRSDNASRRSNNTSDKAWFCCPDGRPRASRGWPIGKAIIGLGVLALGLLLTLDNLHLMDAEPLLDFWPALLILLGIAHILQPRGARRIWAGLLWIAAGSLLLLHTLDMWDFNVWDLWPLILVFVGGNLLLRAVSRGRKRIDPESANTFDATAILGGVERNISCDTFEGGDATAILGACEIDLRDCGSEGGPAEIHTFAFWGGVELTVPDDWEVQVRGTAIMGAFEDKTRAITGEAKKVLIVSGMAIMGGVEIKS